MHFNISFIKKVLGEISVHKQFRGLFMDFECKSHSILPIVTSQKLTNVITFDILCKFGAKIRITPLNGIYLVFI